MIKEENFKNADVLFISDFVMSEIGDELEGLIEEAKKNKTSFHSLLIGASGNIDVFNIFDNNWVYEPDNLRKLVRNVRDI